MIKGIVALHKKVSSRHTSQWRKLKVVYLTISLLLVVISIVSIQIYNSQESCTVSTTTHKESGYYKSGPQNWNNSSYSYDVPSTSSNCSTRGEDGSGASLGLVILLLLIIAIGYLYLPGLYFYLNATDRKSDE